MNGLWGCEVLDKTSPMTARLRWPLLLATILGLAGALWTIGRAGLRQVLASAMQVGAPGFLLLCAITAATFFLLGGSWLAAARGARISALPRFAWSRAAREAANDLLPFSQFGGLMVGARALALGGIAEARIYAAMIVDLSTEMASQIVFTLFALWAFGTILSNGAATLLPVLWGGLGIATVLAVSFAIFQRPALRLAGMLMRRTLPDAGALADDVSAELARVYARPGRVLASFLLNLAAWGATAGWSWLALRLMGVETQAWRAGALESAIFAIRSAAFFIPGALGVQEAGYALLAPLVGIDPAAALALSLLKRARDVALGVPTLLAWQAGEMRPAGRKTSRSA